MRWWEELDVDPGADLKAVRRAYARAIRIWQPETHPERFQRIRAAYEQACNGAARPARSPVNAREGDSGTSLAVRELFHRPMPHIGDPAIDLLAQVAWLFRSPERPYKRMDCWQEIFADPRLWNVECREQFSEGLFSILIGQLRCEDPRVVRICMSRDIWKRIDREMGWSQNEASLFVRFGPGNAEWVMRNVRTALGHGYFGTGPASPAGSEGLLWDWAVDHGVPVLVWALFAAALVGLIRLAVATG